VRPRHESYSRLIFLSGLCCNVRHSPLFDTRDPRSQGTLARQTCRFEPNLAILVAVDQAGQGLMTALNPSDLRVRSIVGFRMLCGRVSASPLAGLAVTNDSSASEGCSLSHLGPSHEAFGRGGHSQA
jgi:hypothetical protein